MNTPAFGAPSHSPSGMQLPGLMPQSRYILPQFEERTAYGLSLIHI